MADLDEIGRDVAEIKTAILGSLDGKPGLADSVRANRADIDRIDSRTRLTQAVEQLPWPAQAALFGALVAGSLASGYAFTGTPISADQIEPALMALQEQREAETAAIKREAMSEALEAIREGSGQ